MNDQLPQTFLEHAKFMFKSDTRMDIYVLNTGKFQCYLDNTKGGEDIDDLTQDQRVWWALLHYAMEERK